MTYASWFEYFVVKHQVIEKQKLERILRDIMTLEAERKQEAGDWKDCCWEGSRTGKGGMLDLLLNTVLGGVFEYFLFSPLVGEMI